MRSYLTWMSMLLALNLLSCLEVAEERALLEERVGQATQAGLELQVEHGASAIRAVRRVGAEVSVDLWAQQPTQRLFIRRSPGAEGAEVRSLRLSWHNVMSGVTVKVEGPSGAPVEAERLTVEGAPVTLLTARVPLASDTLTLSLTPPEPPQGSAWRVGVFADVQERLDGLSELLKPLGEEPVRFCLISGDLTEQGSKVALTTFQAGLERHLPFPCYATLGNHELGTPGPPFHALFGRGSGSFRYGGARVTLLDDASATLAPRTRERLNGWLAEGREQLHLIVTHLPILDADGTRSGAFASRLEAIELLATLAEGGVDLLLYGHVHTFKSFVQAGIPALISGGGGSIPMRFDGVGRHYVVLELDPVRQTTAHRVQEVSPEE